MKKLIVIAIGIIVTAFLIGCGSDKHKTMPIEELKSTDIKDDIVAETKSIVKSEEAELTPQQRLGKRLFIMCEACHNVNQGEPHKVGPNLHGVFGRKAGSVADFKYSEAVMNSDIVWSDETIREWLINPNDYIKGTNMVFVGLPKKRQQDALLSYLHHVAE